MSDDTRSVNHRSRRQPRRVLIVSNPEPGSSSEEGSPPAVCKPHRPRPLPNPSRPLPLTGYAERYHNGPTNPHIPPLTTNVHCYPSSRSNPSNGTLSSPSSSSSPAVESTPPPSTPGLSGPGIHLSEEGTIRQDTIKPPPLDRNDVPPQAPQRQKTVERPITHYELQGLPRRGSLSGSRPATVGASASPTSHLLTCPAVTYCSDARFLRLPRAAYVPPKPHGKGHCAGDHRRGKSASRGYHGCDDSRFHSGAYLHEGACAASLSSVH
ncbi:hypothetical protein OH77DRAFT_417580 [Trametes cingulata]|nr:hypothetical protein OH77DRAFT_417580 [Trametes cingulata]